MLKWLVFYIVFSSFAGAICAFMTDDWSRRPFAYAFLFTAGLGSVWTAFAWAAGAF